MTSINREVLTEIRKRFCDFNQGHVFTWWDEISSEEHDHLFRQLTAIDLDLLKRLIGEGVDNKAQRKQRTLEPASLIHLPRTPEEKERLRKARQTGEDAIRAGKCAAFVVAGSAASDMGLEETRGRFPVTPVTGKSLFQLYTEKVVAMRRRYGVKIPFFVMTSPDNYEATKSFFEDHENFGMSGEDLFFFSQGMLPAVDHGGRLVMAEKGSLYMTPDGHGGSIRSLYNSGALEEMEARGIEHIFYFQVNNPLTVILDPAFIGYHIMEEAEVSSKVVRKRSPEEKVGVLGKINGSLGVVEYTDLSKEEMYARDEEGELKFHAGNIAIHVLDVAFVRRLGEGAFKMSFHKKEKEIEYIDEKGEPVSGGTNKVVKFESFVFDSLQFATSSITLEVKREEEFAPLKNKSGEDSPESCRKMLSDLYRSWVMKAGFQGEEDQEVVVEISPLFALDEADFCSKIKGGGRLLNRKLFIE